MVFPHIKNIEQFHGGITDIYYSDCGKDLDTVTLNRDIIRAEMDKLEIENFSFVLIDGDHNRKSFLSDIDITLPLMDKNGYILIDDVDDDNHELKNYFHTELKHKNDFYLFEDWNIPVGMALAPVRDFKI